MINFLKKNRLTSISYLNFIGLILVFLMLLIAGRILKLDDSNLIFFIALLYIGLIYPILSIASLILQFIAIFRKEHQLFAGIGLSINAVLLIFYFSPFIYAL